MKRCLQVTSWVNWLLLILIISLYQSEQKNWTLKPVFQWSSWIWLYTVIFIIRCMFAISTKIPSSETSKLTNKSGICGSTTEVLNILALLKTLTVDSITAMNCVILFMEGEAVIRAKNLLSLSVFSPIEVASLMKEAKELRRIDDDREIDKLVEVASQTDDSIVNEGIEQARHHVAGYLARTTMNTHKCQTCQDLLVNREASQGSFINNSEEIAEETNSKLTFSFTDYLNRDNFLFPSEMTLNNVIEYVE